jgi:hypothetical protein
MRFSSTQVQAMIDTIGLHESDGNGFCCNHDCQHWPLESPWPNHVATQVVKVLEQL